MKFHVFQLGIALLVAVSCCRAINTDSAIEAANEILSSDNLGKLLKVSDGGDVMHNNAVLHLRKTNSRFAELGEADGHEIYAVDWKSEAATQQGSDRLFLFGLHKEEGTFAPLGYARYDYRGIPHARETFWNQVHGNYMTRTKADMGIVYGFPPEMVAPTRARNH